MGSDAPQKASNYDEIFMQHSLQFAESLQGLKNLRKQLYSAAEYFKSSYDKDDQQQLVIESSKDYVANAVVSTVDHLGSVADKLNRFLDDKANEFSATNIRFSCIEQRLSMCRGFIDLRGVAQHSLIIEAPKHYEQYTVPESSEISQPKLINKNCIPFSQCDMQHHKQGNPFAKGFQVARIKPHPPSSRKGHSRVSSSESSPRPVNFSFTQLVSKKESGTRSVSPLGFPLKRSGSVANRSIPPALSDNKNRYPSQPRRAISVQTRHEMINRGEVGESYAKRSRHFFKALLRPHHSRK